MPVAVEPDDSNRAIAAFRRLITVSLPALRFWISWEYIVVNAASDGTSVDVTCSDPSANMPDLVACPMSPGVQGAKFVPPQGSRVIVVFGNGDPSLFRAISFSQDAAAGSQQPVARQTDTVNAGYLVFKSDGTISPLPYYPGTPAGLIAANNYASSVLSPPGTVVPLTAGQITGGSALAKLA